MNISKKITFIFFIFCLFNSSLGSINDKFDSLYLKCVSSENESEFRTLLTESIKILLADMEKDSAVAAWNKLIEHCEKKGYYNSLGYCYYKMAVRLNNEGDYTDSYLAFEKSKNIYSKINQKDGLACVYNELGNLYYNLNNLEQSLKNYYISASIFKELNDSNYGIIYLNIGGILIALDSIQKSKNYLEQSLKVLDKTKDTSSLVNCFINLSEVYLKKNKQDSVYFYLLKSYEFAQENVNIVDRFNANIKLGEFYMKNGDLVQAIPLLTESFNLTEDEKTKNYIPIEDKAKASKIMSSFYDEAGDSKKAFYYLDKYLKYETELKRNQSILKLSRLEIENTQLTNENIKKDSDLEHSRRIWIMYISIAVILSLIILFFAFYRSYKHKKEANRLLTEMDELKNRLYSNITHELRTPLTLILGPLEQMLSDEAKKTPSHKQVKIMQKNANTLLNLVNQMLDLSKIDAKNMKLELVEEDINKFLRIHFAAFASLAEQKQITYQCSVLKEKNIRIFDAAKLEKIINNLLSNAIKFTRKNGNINCFASFHENKLELIVQDDGKGIPKEELEKIFDRFHRVELNGETITPGTGIGLALTKELVELMHGKIKVESVLDHGSKFTVIIPLGTEHLANDEFQLVTIHGNYLHDNKQNNKSENTHSEEVEDKNTHTENDLLPHVLVVEDNKDIREFISENLTGIFNVELAKNGKAGLKLAFLNIPDLVITDVVMPKMDGIELCSNLKTDEKTSHIPVIMLTGKTGIDDRLKGLETGADAYLNKPFNIKELQIQASKLIEQRQKLRERFTRDLKLEPKDIAVTSVDEKFITRAMEIIEKNIGNSEYEVRQFEEDMFMSRMQLFRKIKALTNQTPGEFIRTIRLKRAASLIKQNFGNIAQVTFEVGFNNPSYFAKCFKELYGVLPSDFSKNQQS